MDDRLAKEVALFRFSLIAPLVNGTHLGPRSEYLAAVEAKVHQIPGVGPRQISAASIRRWLLFYRRRGLDGLVPKIRSDKGTPKKLGLEVREYVVMRKRQAPRITASAIYRELLSANLLGKDPPALSTFVRYVRGVLPLCPPIEERKRFGFAHANDCWQTDICFGPYLCIEGKKQRTYLIAFIDDASRMIPAAEFFLADNQETFLSLLRQAVQKRGIPKMLYTDRGRVFTSLALRTVTAKLGAVLAHAEAYSPESKGKVERFFRTVRMQFLDPLQPENVSSLRELNDLFHAYLEGTYHQATHAALGQSPMQRFLQDQDKLRFASKDVLDRAFLLTDRRRVNNDSTVSLRKLVYELPSALIGQQVTILYRIGEPEVIYLEQGEVLVPYRPVRPLDNAKLPRERTRPRAIDYEALYGGKVHDSE